MKVSELIEELEIYSPDEEIACLLWTRDDVITVVSEEYSEVEFTGEELQDIANYVLKDVHATADADCGICWDNIRETTENVVQNFLTKAGGQDNGY